MLKWLGRLKFWKRELEGPAVHNYGQYVYKPVIARALSEVIGICQQELVSWIQSPSINVLLNDELVQGAQWARRRLEAGQYEIKVVNLKQDPEGEDPRIYRFFIA